MKVVARLDGSVWRLYVTSGDGFYNPAGPRLHKADPWPIYGEYRWTFTTEAEAAEHAVKITNYLNTIAKQKQKKK